MDSSKSFVRDGADRKPLIRRNLTPSAILRKPLPSIGLYDDVLARAKGHGKTRLRFEFIDGRFAEVSIADFEKRAMYVPWSRVPQHALALTHFDILDGGDWGGLLEVKPAA